MWPCEVRGKNGRFGEYISSSYTVEEQKPAEAGGNDRNTKDGSNMFHRNVVLSPNYTAL
jgi:hypothetical protein